MGKKKSNPKIMKLVFRHFRNSSDKKSKAKGQLEVDVFFNAAEPIKTATSGFHLSTLLDFCILPHTYTHPHTLTCIN